MTDMPEGIWAWPARLAYEEVGQWASTRYPTDAEKFVREDVVEARVAEAVAKEREACALVADDHTPEKHSGMTLQAHVTGRNIAAAIRSRK